MDDYIDELNNVGKIVGAFNKYSTEYNDRGIDWYADAMEDIYIIISDHDDGSTLKIIIIKRCALFINPI